MTEIDAKLFLEKKENVKTTFDRRKMKQRLSIPWMMGLFSPMFRGR
jgi:hypothetical protein